MRLNRRTFLQKTGLGLLTLGISEVGLSRYYQTLAQPTARKLALLVGINNYPRSLALTGCVTDVELQRELLIHRFGFHPDDILTLTGQEATRENIETAFLEHLSQQAQPGDVIVFHFSGYGNQVKIPVATKMGEQAQESRLIKSLVPIDGILQTKDTDIVNDLLEETLALLVRSLATDKVTLVLDTSYSYPGKSLQGNLKIRSYPRLPTAYPSPEELAFQSQLRLRFKATGKSSLLLNNPGFLPGVIFAATREDQVATEIQTNNFSAGLFTFALTQYLWQITSPSTLQISFKRTNEVIQKWLYRQQQPELFTNNQQALLTYYIPPENKVGAAAIVTGVEDDSTVQLKLVGMPLEVIEYYGINSRLRVANTELELQLRSREGFNAKARLLDKTIGADFQLRSGQLLQESIRILPRNLGLTVALSNDLSRIEKVDATSALANITNVTTVINAGEQMADCIIAPLGTAINTTNPTSDTKPTQNTVNLGYGLFSVGGVLLPRSGGVASEAIKSAVSRFAPQLETLLAAKLWHLTSNEFSSCLPIRATLEKIEAQNSNPIKALLRRETGRILVTSEPKNNQLLISNNSNILTTIGLGTQIQYRLENHSDRPIYIMLITLTPNQNVISLYCSQIDSNTNSASLKNITIVPGETLVLPNPENALKWMVSGATGLVETQIICSQAPFEKTLTTLANLAVAKGEGEYLVEINHPLALARAILEDLHSASAINTEPNTPNSDVYALDLKAWATLSFIYQSDFYS